MTTEFHYKEIGDLNNKKILYSVLLEANVMLT